MRMSDIVAEYIINTLNNENGIAEIQRNELAQTLGCVPSQINYVITSRFTQEQGYLVESRRGGGGYIRITKLNLDKNSYIMYIVNSIGQSLDYSTAKMILQSLHSKGLLTAREANIFNSAVNDVVYRDIPLQFRDIARAKIFKNMILNLI